MREKNYRVHLIEDERRRLEDIASKGVHPARQIIRARILLLLNEGTDHAGKPVAEQSEIARRYGCSTRVVYMVSRQYVE